MKDKTLNIVKIIIFFITISISFLFWWKILNPYIAIWLAWISGALFSFLIILFLEKILPQTFDKSLITERKGEVELKLDNDPYGLNFDLYNNDIEIILAYGKCLENLPKDRLPNSNDLPYSINRITEAIERLKNYKYIPENLRTIGIQAANFLELYKLGDKYVRDNNA